MLPDCPDQTSAEQRLTELQERYPWPAGCSLAHTFFERARVGELELGMVGLVAQLPGERSATGAAASSGGGLPVDRALFELFERVAILLAPSRSGALALRDRSGATLGARPIRSARKCARAAATRRTARSNGVALHTSWQLACAAAQHELLERDRVLRSFRGEFPARPCPLPDGAVAHALRAHYRVEAYQIDPSPRPSAVQVRGLFLFPRQPEVPIAYGFAAADSGEEALSAAQREALQRLAFLWGEPLPAAPPCPAPVPDFHQDYYLYPPHHAALRAWLSAAHAQRSVASDSATPLDTRFLDLTPDVWRDRLAIARATSPHVRALRFGVAPSDHRAPHPIV